MADPSEAIYPKKYIRSVRVLYDGTQPPHLGFSIAELVLHDGRRVIGVRYDENGWNETTPNRGYPVVRGGRPSWFLLPDNHEEFIEILNQVLINR